MKKRVQGLSVRARRFVQEFLVDYNASRAAARAGYSAHSSGQKGYELLGIPIVAEAIENAIADLEARTQITQEKVLRRWWDLATADPNDLVQYRRINCRHCFGEGHAYQWIDGAEYEEACAQAERNERGRRIRDPNGDPLLPPSDAGGYGYERTLDPNPSCPKCHGEGISEAFVADTRNLRGPAKLLYAGVKVTKDGVEVKMHDQLKALDNVAKHLGMFIERAEVTGKDGGPIQGAVNVQVNFLPGPGKTSS